VLLFALAVYVVAAAGWSLPTRAGASFSGPGLFISIAAIPVMWVLSRRKLRIVDALGSRALRTDAVIANLRVVLACCRYGAASAAHACRMVGRLRGFADNSVAASQRGLGSFKRG
jgi:divalent metal cation (Fe/Co/Zn/Cd) transporter